MDHPTQQSRLDAFFDSLDARLPWGLRSDLLLVMALGLLAWIAFTPRSAIFLGPDTATQDYMALAWSQGCWEYFSEKLVAVWLLGPLFALFGADPLWETALLALFSMLTLAGGYDLSRRLSGSRLGGLLTALALLAVPGQQAYAHTYFGYIYPGLLLGWIMVVERRWFWSGVGFGLAFVAHFNTLVPLAFSGLALLLLLLLRREPWQALLRLIGGGLLPLLLAEALMVFYIGRIPPQPVWLLGTFAVIFRFGGVASSPDWAFMLRHLLDFAGPFIAGLTLLGLAAPWLYRRSGETLAITLSFLATAAFFVVQAGTGSGLVLSRSLMPSYPFWIMAGALTLCRGLERLAAWPALQRPAWLRMALPGLFAAGLSLAAVDTGLWLRAATHTLTPQIGQWIEQAGEAGLPVKVTGPWAAALFYAQRAGVEALVADSRWLEADQSNQAVLIFHQPAPDTLDPRGYRITRLSLPPLTADDRYAALRTELQVVRHVELWWPLGEPAQTVRPASPPDMAFAAQYYRGSGCLYPPPYGENRDMYFFQLALQRLLHGRD